MDTEGKSSNIYKLDEQTGQIEDAYVLMRDALIEAGLKLFAKEILDYDPPSTSLRRALTENLMPQLSAMLIEEDLEHLVS